MANEWGAIEYPTYYPCCAVVAKATRKEPCWVCKDGTGVDYYQAREILPPHQWPPRESGVYMQMSTISPEMLACPHP